MDDRSPCRWPGIRGSRTRRPTREETGAGSATAKAFTGRISTKISASRISSWVNHQARARSRLGDGCRTDSKTMANETLIARLEQSLRQSRAARTRLSARLAELESEAEIIRAELAEMDTLAGQTEAAIFRLLSNVMSGPSTPV